MGGGLVFGGEENQHARIELVDEFLATLPERVAKLNEDVAQQDYEGAAKIAHTLKGASGSVCLNEICRLLVDFEAALRGHDYSEAQAIAKRMLIELA